MLTCIASFSAFKIYIFMDFVHPAFEIEPLHKLVMKQTIIILDYKEGLPYCLQKVKPPPKYNYVPGTFDTCFSINTDPKIG
jgi:hypothetical protein